MRPISISTVVYDGHDIDTAFAGIAELGLGLVEPAYIRNYMKFEEADFEDAAQRVMRQRLSVHGLKALAISAHMDSGNPEAEAMLARRIRFAAAVGATYMITNSTAKANEARFRGVMESSLKLAEELGVVIALENNGNGPEDLMRDGEMAAALVRSFASPWLSLNYDTANAWTCTGGAVLPHEDIDNVLDVACHMHLKDVMRLDGHWQFTPIGAGSIDYGTLFAKLAAKPDLPVTIELPLTLVRPVGGSPSRSPKSLNLDEIRAAIQESLAFVAGK